MQLEEYTPISELVVHETDIRHARLPVIDAHSHWGKLLLGDNYNTAYDTRAVVDALKSVGLKGIINVDGFWGDELDKMLAKTEESDGFIRTFSSVDVTRVEERSFETLVYRTIRDAKAKGVSGLKFWKVIGLLYRYSDGRYIRPDDERLSCIWQCAAEENLPVLFHIADPVAFFKQIDSKNERYEELNAHPDWAFNAPELYSFQQLMEMQYHLVASNPKTTFILAHVAGYSENLAAVGKWLDELPNLYVDIAERISELGRQPYTARRFLTKYADRILFGTDMTPTTDMIRHLIYFRFLETQDEYFRYDATENGKQGRWRIYGVDLSDDVLEKIYTRNIEKLIGQW